MIGPSTHSFSGFLHIKTSHLETYTIHFFITKLFAADCFEYFFFTDDENKLPERTELLFF